MAKLQFWSFGVISSIDIYLLVRVLKDLTAPSALRTLMLGNGPLDGQAQRVDQRGSIMPGGNMASWLVAIKGHQSSAV